MTPRHAPDDPAHPRVVAEFSTEPAPGEPKPRRWTRLRITQVRPREYQCEKVRGPEPLEEKRATVSDLDQAKEFFGDGWVVKELFAAIDPKKFPRYPRKPS
ncbi:MAG TPA: hypothetical protein VJM11_10805 [Nevskiaceae bacterium]|nr:hypothetical protein [Nevskiaceae bacterium]